MSNSFANQELLSLMSVWNETRGKIDRFFKSDWRSKIKALNDEEYDLIEEFYEDYQHNSLFNKRIEVINNYLQIKVRSSLVLSIKDFDNNVFNLLKKIATYSFISNDDLKDTIFSNWINNETFLSLPKNDNYDKNSFHEQTLYLQNFLNVLNTYVLNLQFSFNKLIDDKNTLSFNVDIKSNEFLLNCSVQLNKNSDVDLSNYVLTLDSFSKLLPNNFTLSSILRFFMQSYNNNAKAVKILLSLS